MRSSPRTTPSSIRELYTGALRKDHPSDRHRQLLRLGEASLAYLAALAFADYCRARIRNPVSEVEEAVRRIGEGDDRGLPSIVSISSVGLAGRRYDAPGYYEVMTPLLEAPWSRHCGPSTSHMHSSSIQ